MQEQIQLITCKQCSYRFNPEIALRCPRCNKPVIKSGGCFGSCTKCINAGVCESYKEK
ncbi:hypothetical protein SPSYN_01780 [Sporotomaculum syntrophicum]|uniref:Uncharacterized protein n=1 Tax=Sporotomaculum syntrophicum TaxID=182264 RepID=A0A9D2WQ91_9FIRM|nr:hypothetical protein [Sporotomaculum syntrophicum]KAF1085637.1 hypothetical protein SPSYN_01780 [Sporotomaculum syntrophicum]